jgi:hypothetical protein
MTFEAGIYFLKVSMSGSSNYQLTLSKEAVSGTSFIGGGQLPTISAGQISLSNSLSTINLSDIYTFNLATAGEVVVGLGGVTSGGSVSLNIVDSGNNIYGTLVANGSNFVNSTVSLASGSYSLVTTGSTSTNYNLTLSGS